MKYGSVFRCEDGIEVKISINAKCSTPDEMSRVLSFVAQSSHQFYLELAGNFSFRKGREIGIARPRGTDSARVIEVIETESLRGKGTEDDKCRKVKQYWDFRGNLLAEYDSCMERENFEGGRCYGVEGSSRGV